eukprot:gene31975-1968_t
MISVVRDRADDNIMRNGARTRQTGAESLLFIFLLAVVPSTTNGIEIRAGNLASTYTGKVYITGNVVLNGISKIDGDLQITSGGSLTHDLTADKAKTIELTVTGRLTIEKGGTINANRKSS